MLKPLVIGGNPDFGQRTDFLLSFGGVAVIYGGHPEAGTAGSTDSVERILKDHAVPLGAAEAGEGFLVDLGTGFAGPHVGAGEDTLKIIQQAVAAQGRLRQNTLVATVMSNMGLDIAMKKHGVKMEKTKVGDRYVLEKMLADGFNLGGEQSGHVILLDHNTTGDGLITAVQVISAMVQAKQPLSRLASVMQMMPQSLYAANVSDTKKYDYDKNEKIAAKIAELEAKYKDKGRLVIRASGTEPRVRVMIEGPNQREIEHDVFALSKLIERELRD